MSRTSSLKILFLASSFPRDEHDVASVFLRYMAESLVAHGNQVHVLVPADGKSSTTNNGAIKVHRFQYFPLPWQKLAYGSGIIPNLSRSPWLWLQVPFYAFAMFWALLRLLRQEKFDLLHAHWILPQGLIALLARTFHPIPLVTTAHGADAFALKGRVNAFIKRLVVSKSDAWTANTPATSVALSGNGSMTRARFIPMGVEVRRFANGDRRALRARVAESDFLLLFVGRLVEKKGVDDLLRALTLLPPASKSRARLWIVGDGDRRAELENIVREWAIDKQVRFWGMVPNQELPDFYAAADLFVAPSIEAQSGDSEGQGVVFLEAFAARLCVLATLSGGIDAIVHHQRTGILVKPQRPQELASAIERLMCDAALRTTLAENAYADVKQLYDWQRIAGDFDQLYRELIPSAR